MWSVPPAAIAGIPTFVGSRHYDSFADRAPVYFTCGCPAQPTILTKPKNLQLLYISILKNRMPQWWSRRWPPWDAPHRQKVALCILSLRVHAIPLRVAPMPAVFRYDLNGGLPTCIRFIIYQEYMVIVYYVFCKPDMVSVSILVE